MHQSLAAPPALAGAETISGEREQAARDEPGMSTEGEGEREGEGGESAGEIALASAVRIDQLAYPRAYVSGRQALRSRVATEAAPAALAKADFVSGVRMAVARAQAGSAWRAIGGAGLATPASSPWSDVPVASGRITALIVDPHCEQPEQGCRLWLGAAGGGVWRTLDATAATPTWTFVSADIPSNAIGSLALDPNDLTGNTLYAGTGEPNGSTDSEAGIGLYKTTDGGDTWALVPGSMPLAMDRSIGTIAVQPGFPAQILIGLALARHGSGSVTNSSQTPPNAAELGVYASTDGGTTFAQVLAPLQPGGDPALQTDSQAGSATQLAFDPLDPTIAYAAITGSGIWRRTLGAWEYLLGPIEPTDEGARFSFAVVSTGAEVHLYAIDGSTYTGADAFGVVARTLDAHAPLADLSWDNLSNAASYADPQVGVYGLCGQQCFYDQVVTAQRVGDHDVVWIGGSTQYGEVYIPGGEAPSGVSNGRAVVRSANAEAVAVDDILWNDMTGSAADVQEGIHPDLHAIAVNPADPAQAFIGSDGGIVRTDGGFEDASAACLSRENNILDNDLMLRCQQLLSSVPARITGLNTGLNTLQLVDVASTPAQQGRLVAGYQDNGTSLYEGGSLWTGVLGGDGGAPAIDHAVPTTVFHQYYGATVEVSYQGGAPGTWYSTFNPFQVSSEEKPFYAALVTDPVTSGTVFTGLEHVWRTTDNGGTQAQLIDADCGETGSGEAGCGDWVPLGPNLADVAFGSRDGGTVSAIARPSGTTQTLWAATSKGRVFISSNATAAAPAVAFTRIDDDSTFTPTRFPTRILVDPTNPNHAWVAYAGYDAYTPTTPGHLFEVRFNPLSQTAAWMNRSFDLGDVPLRTAAYDPLLGDIYAAGDWGVLRLPGGATAWMDAGSALPAVATYGLAIEPAQRLLYAATHGRGVYALTLPSPAPGPAALPAPAALPTAKAASYHLLKAPTVTRTTLSYSVFAPTAGTITTVVRVLGRARSATIACRSVQRVAKQGSVRATCRLTAAVRRLRSTTGVRLALRSTFAPKAGSIRVLTRRFAIGPVLSAPVRVTG